MARLPTIQETSIVLFGDVASILFIFGELLDELMGEQTPRKGPAVRGDRVGLFL